VTTNDSEPQYEFAEPDMADTPAPRNPLNRGATRFGRILRHGPVLGILATVAIIALIGSAYVVGSPAGSGGDSTLMYSFNGGPVASTAPVAMRLGAFGAAGNVDTTTAIGAPGDVPAADAGSGGVVQTPDQTVQLTTIEAAQIVKTGALSLEVADIDKSSTLAQAAISGLGGYVSASSRSGSGDNVISSITFHVPSAKWDEALAAIRKLGSKTISEETDSTDVTAQVIDLNARLDNLQRTETALQAIMNKATVIADVLAVQNQLTQTQGQIEQLTAQRDHLKSQAAMSTLTATFQLPSKTVITQAAQGWTLGDQVDQAGAALVRIGQGLATIGVWILVVILPVGFATVILLGLVTLLRRIRRRGKHQNSAPNAAQGA
jgi:hypothetical protein